MRVLAFAEKDARTPPRAQDEAESELVFVGLALKTRHAQK